MSVRAAAPQGSDGNPPSSLESASSTFVLHEHGHTLANAVRYMCMKHPDIEFAAYSMPHPSEEIVNLRIQTTGRPAAEILRESVKNVRRVTKHISREFNHALAQHDEAKAKP
eukprot:GDKH01028809.1.p1 GENE.GDKH01028809.1~~GDKH01028809.1.p1  ORF type:complete len:112 (-),score=9.18 GDKH01028809.1:72-407(-)